LMKFCQKCYERLKKFSTSTELQNVAEFAKFLRQKHFSDHTISSPPGSIGPTSTAQVNGFACIDCSEAANADEWVCQLALYFDNVIRSMYTMFVVLTGENWIDIAAVANHYASWTTLLFIIYILFVNICLVNLITGVIVESAYASRDKAAFKQAAANAKNNRERFGRIFRHYCDEDMAFDENSIERRYISKARFIALLNDDEIKEDPSDDKAESVVSTAVHSKFGLTLS